MNDADHLPELQLHGQAGSLTAAKIVGVVVGLAIALGGFALAYPALVSLWGDQALGMTLTLLTLMALLFIPFAILWRVIHRIDHWAQKYNLGGHVVLHGNQLTCTGPKDKWERVFDAGQQFEVEVMLIALREIGQFSGDTRQMIPRISTVIIEQNKLSVALVVVDDVLEGAEIPLFEGPIVTHEIHRHEPHPHEIRLDRPEVQALLDRLNCTPKQ